MCENKVYKENTLIISLKVNIRFEHLLHHTLNSLRQAF